MYASHDQPHRAHRSAVSLEAAAAELRRPAALLAGLTAREAEVLTPAASGLTTAQIAERLVISPKTADGHIQHIYAKIGCSTRGATVLFALKHHLAGNPPS